jgi:hypothetical protein
MRVGDANHTNKLSTVALRQSPLHNLTTSRPHDLPSAPLTLSLNQLSGGPCGVRLVSQLAPLSPRKAI